MSTAVHIISHEVPYPPSIGGVIDIYNTIKSLSNIGVQVYLHCFTLDGKVAPELNAFCVEVNYYERQIGLGGIRLPLPYIVSSRRNKDLIHRLLQDDHPIICEGIHTTALLHTKPFIHRKIFVRLFNTETLYYKTLHQFEKNAARSFYFKAESELLQVYEKKLSDHFIYLPLSETDEKYFTAVLKKTDVRYLPAFISPNVDGSITGTGDFALYHGNLKVNENVYAVEWLAHHVFGELDIDFVVAGRKPSAKLKELVSKFKNVKLVANPDNATLNQLIQNAQVNLIPSFNCTGVKLKLLNAIGGGRHILANTAGVAGSGLETLCHIADSPEEFVQSLKKLYTEPFTFEEKIIRQQRVASVYNNARNAVKLSAWLQ